MKKLRIIYPILMVVVLFTINAIFSPGNQALFNSINGKQRSDQNKARDNARHPQKTLEFFDVKPNATVMEIWPGKGWYTEILAPYIKHGGGKYIAAGFPLHVGPQWRQDMQREYQDYLSSHPNDYDAVSFVEFGPPTFWSLGEDNSVDTVLTFRNVHNWVKGGYEKEMFQAMYQVLKPGGVLGVVDHRANPNTDIETMKQTGYMTEQAVIALAQQAGFILLSASEINANPKDTKDYAKGVWTLPPTLRLEDDNQEKYLAIGESDRMTLKFRKPI
jgi:predicted methyltransferase